MRRFSIKTEIVFDDNSVSYLKDMTEQNFFIITDPFMVTGGMINKVTDLLKDKDYRIFSKIVPDPPLETVARAIKEIGEYNPQCVLAVGGGSAIDTAKAVIYYAKLENVKFIAIPTTSGTGSEVTSFSVITDKAKGVKYPLVSDKMLPDIAILETDFVKTVPPNVVADTGIDVLTHSIEAYVSKDANDFSDAFAEKAIAITKDNLIKSYNGDFEAKKKMHTASLMAGLAFNSASLGLNHAIAHNVGGRLHLPHGRINGMLLTEVIKFNSGVKDFSSTDHNPCAKRYAEIAKIMGINGTNTKILVRGLCREIEKMQKALKIPKTFSEAKIKADADIFEAIAEGALGDSCIKTNPQTASKSDIINILNNIR